MTSGIHASASTQLIAVSVMLSATSPRARWLKMLATAPPGEDASSISPTARMGGRSNSCVIRNAMPTSTMVCTNRPMTTARGKRSTRAKSAACSDRPRPNMMMATAPVSSCAIIAESMLRVSGRPCGRGVQSRSAAATSAKAVCNCPTCALVVAGQASIML